MQAADLKIGLAINYRGQRAVITDECWTRAEDAPSRYTYWAPPADDAPEGAMPTKVRYAAGCVIEWGHEDAPEVAEGEEAPPLPRCRLLFKNATDTSCDGLNGELALWGE